jgi:hypothetical protein
MNKLKIPFKIKLRKYLHISLLFRFFRVYVSELNENILLGQPERYACLGYNQI